MSVYDQDSFFTLSMPGQIGLAVLSLVLAAGMLFTVWRSTRSRPFALRMAIALLLFAAFEWGSPQVYYTYYRTIIPGLPLQWVIGSLPDPAVVLRLLMFSESHDLSAHGRGILGWAMLMSAALARGNQTTGQESES